MPREQVYRYKAEIDHQSMRQQLDQMRSAVGVSMQLQSPSYTHNAMGMVGAGQLGFNTLTSDLRGMAGSLSSITPSMAPSQINMGLSQSIMGVMGLGGSKTMHDEEYQRIAQRDLSSRLSRGVGGTLANTIEFGANWGPEIGFAMAGYGTGGLGGALKGAGLGMWNMGMGWGALGMGTGMVASYAAGKVKDQLKAQNRFENMIYSGSKGKVGYGKRSALARDMRQAVGETYGIDNNDGAEVLAYGTESGMLDATKSADEFGRKYKSLLKATQTIMKTFHQSIKDSVRMMGQLKNSGIFDIENMESNALLVKARSELAGLSTSNMFGLQQGAVQQGTTIIGSKASGGAATLIASTIGGMFKSGAFTEKSVFDVTQKSGEAGRIAMASSATSAIIGSMNTGTGTKIMAGLMDADGNVDESRLDALKRGDPGALMNIVEAGSANASRDGVRTTIWKAKRAMKSLSAEDHIEMSVGRAKYHGRQMYGKKAMDAGLNEGQFAAILEAKEGITDDAAQRYLYQVYRDPGIIERSKKKAAIESIMNKAKTIEENTGFWATADKMGSEVGQYLAKPFVELNDSIHGIVSGAIGGDAEGSYEGGRLDESRNLSIPLRRPGIMGYVLSNKEATQVGARNLFNKMFKDESLRFFYKGNEGRLHDMIKGGSDQLETLINLRGTKDGDKLDDKKYMKEQAEKLAKYAGGGNMARGLATKLMEQITSGDTEGMVTSAIGEVRMGESLINIRRQAKVIQSQMHKGNHFAGLNPAEEFWLLSGLGAALDDDITEKEALSLRESLKNIDPKAKGNEDVATFKEALDQLKSGKGRDNDPKIISSEAYNRQKAQSDSARQDRLLTALEKIALYVDKKGLD